MDTDIQTPPARSAVETFVATCEDLGRLEREGAPEDERLVAKMYIAIALADIIIPNGSEEDRANLVMMFMNDRPLEVPDTNTTPEVPDTNTIPDDEQSDAHELDPA